jgi:hypothetical protein
MVTYAKSSTSLATLARDLATGALQIPPHQREFVWPSSAMERLVRSVLRGLPIPDILLRRRVTEDGRTVTTLEDGRQRLTSLQKYMNNEFRVDGQLFRELEVIAQMTIRLYIIGTTTYEDATDDEAVEIFNNQQNGVPLSVGEKLWSLQAISPVVRFALRELLTPGQGFYDRTVPFWGERDPRGARDKNLLTAVALVAGIAFGSEYISRKWKDLYEIAPRAFNEDIVRGHLENLVLIFEHLHDTCPVTTKLQRNKYWDPANFTAYIAHSLTLTTEKESVLSIPSANETVDVWYEFLVEQRAHPEILRQRLRIDADSGDARQWEWNRWHSGWKRLFHPEAFGNAVVNRVESEDGNETEEEC